MKILIGMGLALAILGGLGAIGRGIYVAGKQAAIAEYATRDSAALQAAIKDAERARGELRALESAHAEQLAKIQGEADAAEREGKSRLDSALADVRDGARRLRQCSARAAAGRQGAAAAPGAAAGAAADADDGRLPRADAEFLVRFAAHCNAVRDERNEAAAIAMEDRRLYEEWERTQKPAR